jgi:hypothetical protein
MDCSVQAGCCCGQVGCHNTERRYCGMQAIVVKYVFSVVQYASSMLRSMYAILHIEFARVNRQIR